MEAFRAAVSHLLDRFGSAPSTPAGRLCADFLRALASLPGERDGVEARRRLEAQRTDPERGPAAAFLAAARERVEREVEGALRADASLRERLEHLAGLLGAPGNRGDDPEDELVEAFWEVFCPQAAGIRGAWEGSLEGLRERRTIEITRTCEDPIRWPAREILFTSNALLTVPPAGRPLEALDLPESFRNDLEPVLGEAQAFWYDHPVQIGTTPDENEILYGLRGLSRMLAYEKSRGNAAPEERLAVALSVSVTHPGLKGLARSYIESELRRAPGIQALDLHIFTERDTERLVDALFRPAARHMGLDDGVLEALSGVFGVDGAYGRHYNFLKAVSALWRVLVDPGVRATFKIDLDQLFPQEVLVEETGQSAFDLLRTPLWGAQGRDADGRPVSLGMIAGALVNEGDIGRGLFTPDVVLPERAWSPDEWVFCSQVPQALSTAAEMMCRYGEPPLDGTSRCLSRVHVTGGTVGIRVDSLRRHRPFTLSFIGRAEDQAYLVSVLFAGEPCLRYVHAPGLIMRHDKQAFAGEAIRSAAVGKLAGDYERMLLFSAYADALPWPREASRSALDPFTGTFVLSLPFTTVMLRLALKALTLESGGAGQGLDAEGLVRVATARLEPLVARFAREPDWIRLAYERETRAWSAFYEILDRVESLRAEGSAEAQTWIENAASIVSQTKVQIA